MFLEQAPNFMFLVGLTYSVIAGILSVALLMHALRERSEEFFLLSLLFLIVSWSGMEWGLWILGDDMFKLVAQPIVPLASYFVAWSALVVYLAERYFMRRDWVLFFIAVFAISIIAHFCMDCFRFPWASFLWLI